MVSECLNVESSFISSFVKISWKMKPEFYDKLSIFTKS